MTLLLECLPSEVAERKCQALALALARCRDQDAGPRDSAAKKRQADSSVVTDGPKPYEFIRFGAMDGPKP